MGQKVFGHIIYTQLIFYKNKLNWQNNTIQNGDKNIFSFSNFCLVVYLKHDNFWHVNEYDNAVTERSNYLIKMSTN